MAKPSVYIKPESETILALDTLSYGLIVGVSVGFAAGYLGSLMVIEKMALVGDALSHVALPGLALGYLLNFNPLIGGFVFLFVSAVLIWHLGRVTRLSFETLVGAAFTLALAVGILIFPNLEALEEALFGDIARVGLVEAIAAIAISILVVFLTRAIYKKIVLGLISEELATSKKIPVAKLNLLYLLLVSLTVAVGIQITGTLLVGFLVITPAAAARIISANLKRYFLLSGIFGAFSAVSGILLSSYLSSDSSAIPPGPLVVLSGIVIFASVIIIRWRTKFAQ
jgi:ABC-type Mn2+/Zn2+ transport system permease subunit